MKGPTINEPTMKMNNLGNTTKQAHQLATVLLCLCSLASGTRLKPVIILN